MVVHCSYSAYQIWSFIILIHHTRYGRSLFLYSIPDMVVHCSYTAYQIWSFIVLIQHTRYGRLLFLYIIPDMVVLCSYTAYQIWSFIVLIQHTRYDRSLFLYSIPDFDVRCSYTACQIWAFYVLIQHTRSGRLPFLYGLQHIRSGHSLFLYSIRAFFASCVSNKQNHVFTSVQIISLFPYGSLSQSGYFENRIPLKLVLGEVGGWGGGGEHTLPNFIAVYEKTSLNQVSDLVFLFVLCFQRQHFRFLL